MLAWSCNCRSLARPVAIVGSAPPGYGGGMRIPTCVLAPVGLIGGFAVAPATENRALGGAVLFVTGLVCAYVWWRRRELLIAAALLGVYLLGFGLSHPLSKVVGA